MINEISLKEYQKIEKLLGENLDKFKDKSLLITGANGLIGSYIVDFLMYLNQEKSANITVYAMSRSKEKLVKRFGDKENLKLVEQDLNDPIKEKSAVDYIVHAASNAHPMAFSTDPVGTMKSNLFGTMNLLELAKENSARFLYISSGEIYGNNVDRPFTEEDLGVIDTKLARSCYPEAKRAAETLCVAYNAQYNVSVNVARLCYVYGATITDTNSRADAQFLRKALNKENIVMKSKGEQRRTYCYVADVASAVLFILLNGKDGEFYNVANGNSIVSVKEYAQTLADISGVRLDFELPSEVEAKGYSKPADSILSADKLCSLGWKAFYSIREGLEHTLKLKEKHQ